MTVQGQDRGVGQVELAQIQMQLRASFNGIGLSDYN
jgi:hypothetical protein